ncbi:MAG: glycoside hydrolase family 1 protein [Chloroflexi bacterium]|nr:MAG: glycoside hydrolase family 1 protein [Chloroflexota bacterium]
MPQATFHFPAGFLWGAGTAAHQVEGSNTNNNWAYWENQPNRIHNGEKAGRACDWWAGRWRDDFDRAKETHQNAHRMSVEWSRIQPTPDRWNEDALDVYREMLRGLSHRGMTPFVTLHHFSDPLWLFERGGWENAETPALFEAFVRRVVEALREFCKDWIPINEPNLYTYFGYLDRKGAFPPGKNDLGAAFRVMANLVRGHALAYRAIKSIQRDAQVGTSVHVRYFAPAHTWNPLEKMITRQVWANLNASFLDTLADGRLRFLMKSTRIAEAIGTSDFTGMNYYTGDLVSFSLFNPGELFSKRAFPKDAPLSETGFIANWPAGLFQMIKWARRYKLPVIITENGVEDPNDRLRPRYLVEHLHQVWRAINFNWPVKGYFHWSLVDNFEWERGWSQRFGLWGLDLASQARIRRPSVDLYAAICKQNAISAEIVAKYAPEVMGTMFPG